MSEPARVRLMLVLDELGGATVQELCDECVMTQKNVSRHLFLLRQAGLVSRSRQGRSMRYELVDWTALWLVQQVAASVRD